VDQVYASIKNRKINAGIVMVQVFVNIKKLNIDVKNAVVRVYASIKNRKINAGIVMVQVFVNIKNLNIDVKNAVDRVYANTTGIDVGARNVPTLQSQGEYASHV
jgi:hypothetical protein